MERGKPKGAEKQGAPVFSLADSLRPDYASMREKDSAPIPPWPNRRPSLFSLPVEDDL